MIKLLCDIDGVLAQFTKNVINYINEYTGQQLDPEIDPPVYDITKWGFDLTKGDPVKLLKQWVLDGGYKTLDAFPDALWFAPHINRKYNLFVVTARVGDYKEQMSSAFEQKAKQDTYWWLKEKFDIPEEIVFFSNDKPDFCRKYGISIMVEDKLETAVRGAKQGIHSVLLDRGYNKSKKLDPFIHRVYNLKEALEKINELAA